MRLSRTGIRVSVRLDKALPPPPFRQWAARSLGHDMALCVTLNRTVCVPALLNGVVERRNWPYTNAHRGWRAIWPARVFCHARYLLDALSAAFSDTLSFG
jgi:hypothetical protein